jgi:hypothetical protein
VLSDILASRQPVYPCPHTCPRSGDTPSCKHTLSLLALKLVGSVINTPDVGRFSLRIAHAQLTLCYALTDLRSGAHAPRR